MIDRLFAPVLTFVMLIACNALMVAALFAPQREVVAVQENPALPVYEMEMVEITGKRAALEAPAAERAKKQWSAAASPAAEGRGMLLRRAPE